MSAARFLVDAEWTGERWRLLENTAEQVCECGHLLSAHAPGLKCRTCGNECSIDASVMFGVPPVEHVGAHDLAVLLGDELDRIGEALERIDRHSEAIADGIELEDMADRLDADTHVIACAVTEARRLTEVLGPCRGTT
jgi:hypothetical protein